MFCPSCGANVPDKSKFCPKCGNKFDAAEAPNSSQGNTNEPTGSDGGEGGKRMSYRTIGIIIAAAVVVAAGVITAVAVSNNNSRVSINMNDYLSVSDYGFDGYGTVDYHINVYQLRADYAGELELTSEKNDNSSANAEFTSDEDPIDIIIDTIDVYPNSTSDDLSNGDKVTFTWDASTVNYLEKYINVSLKTNNYEHTVSDLDKVDHEDFFNYVSVDFSGTSSKGEAALTVDCNWLNKHDFSIDHSSDLTNGDVITVTINDSTILNIISFYGKAPTETTKQYTVEGLSEYITSLSDISEEGLEAMKSNVDSRLEGTDSTDKYTTLDNIEFLGCYLTVPINGNNIHNTIYLLYKFTETISIDGESKTFNRYWFATYVNGKITENGDFDIKLTISWYPQYDSEMFQFNFAGTSFKFSGFETLEAFEEYLANKDVEIVDSTVTE